MDWLKKLLSGNSDVSTMRLMSLGALLVGAVIAFIGLWKKLDLYGLATLCGVFIGAAFTGKVAQKHVENSKSEE